MDRLTAEIRVGVTLDETVEQARTRIERVIAEACAGDTWLEQNPPHARLIASGFGSAATPWNIRWLLRWPMRRLRFSAVRRVSRRTLWM